VPNAKLTVQPDSQMGGGDQADIQIYFVGQKSEVLERYKPEIVDRLKNVEGLQNLDNSSRSGKPEVTLLPDRLKLSTAGITIYDLAMSLRDAVNGIVATKYREGGNEYDIRVKLKDESVDTPEEIGNIPVATGNGTYRLAHFANVSFSKGFSKIIHHDKFTTIIFSGSTAPHYSLSDVVTRARAALAQIHLPEGYRFDMGGIAQIMGETMMEMLQALLIAILLTYMLLAAILENLFQPLLILATFVLALIGVFVAMFVTHQTFNITSQMAIIMLLGIVVNNAILLLDYTNQLIRGGKGKTDALVEACPTKLKPILMANIAIVLGMLPMALGLGAAGAEMRRPMGVVMIGGLLVATLLTLFVIPVVFNMMGARRERKRASNSDGESFAEEI
jgi:HAE1 family hydrophobic/amphiphilic exporter-1